VTIVSAYKDISGTPPATQLRGRDSQPSGHSSPAVVNGLVN